nr:hypothetical protein [Tanacetum cinerariifolium]
SHTTHSSSSLPPVTTTIPTVTPSETTPIRQYTRRARIAQSFALPTVADKPKSPLRDISQGEACPTDAGFITDQDRVTIAKSSTLPYDSAPRVTSPAAVEGSIQQTINELTALCTSLQRQYSELAVKFEAQGIKITRLKARLKLLEDRQGVAAEGYGDDAPIKGRSLDKGETAAERTSDDTKEMAIVLTSMDAATVLASGAAEVPTGSGSIRTAGPPTAEVPTGSDVVPTASLVFATATMATPYRRRKARKELEEQLEREDQRRSAQIARDVEIARIHVEKELQIMINGLDRNNETMAKYLGMIFEEVEAKFNSVWKQLEDFIPMEEVTEEAKSSDEVPEEKVKEMMQLVPIKVVFVEALQFKHPIIDWKHLDREDLNQLWRLVKETISNRPPTSDKEMELWVELSRLYEPNHEDQLWTHTQNLMHAPVEWKPYDSYEVHHVTSKDKEIFMLVEKDYPLRKGLALVIIIYKLQVKNYSQMGRIVGNKMHKAFPLPGIEFPLAVEVLTASEEGCHCQKKRDATARMIVLLSNSKRNCQSKLNVSFTKSLKTQFRSVFVVSQVSMDSLSPQAVYAAKLPILNPNEFYLWKMRIEQYFLMTDYSLWEVILNGDSPVPTRVVKGVIQPFAPTTVEQRLAQKNELKAHGTLLMALLDKHQLKFNSHKDAKTLIVKPA